MDSVSDNATRGDRRVELLTGPGRRRKWSDEEKARIVAEAAQPGVVVSEIARRWQVTPQQLFDWRRQARKALAAARAPAAPAFVPIVSTGPVAITDPAAPSAGSGARIEVRLAGAELRIASGTDAALLTMVLRAILLGSARLFADETTLPVLDPGRGRTKTGHAWAIARDDRPWGGSDPPAVVFR
jgi:transposase